MANSDKNILITPQTGQASDPTIVFTGGSNTPVTLTVENDGSLSFSSAVGDLLSITNSLGGIIFSVNDANTTPVIEVEDDGSLYLNEFKGNRILGGAELDVNRGETITFTVTVATKTINHGESGGSTLAYFINGIEAPHITFVPGVTYKFDLSDSSCSGHTLAFYYDNLKAAGYTTGYSSSGTAGSAGSYVELLVTEDTPGTLWYESTSSDRLGWSVGVSSHTLTGFTTNDLTEGNSNLYYTDARAQGAFTQGTGVTINAGQISIGQAVATSSTPTFSSLTLSGATGLSLSSSTGAITAGHLNLKETQNVIVLNSDLGAGTAPTANVNISFNRGSSADALILWDEVNDVWKLHNGTSEGTIYTSYSTDVDADTLGGQNSSYHLNYNNFTNTPDSILDFNISDGIAGQVLQTDGNGNFNFTTVTTGGGSGGQGFVAVNAYHYTSSGSTTFGTATNQWLYFQPFINGVLVDDSAYSANTITGIVTFNTAPSTGSQVSIYTYNSSTLDNLDQLSVANTGDLTIAGTYYGNFADIAGTVKYGVAQTGTGTYSVSSTNATNLLAYTSNNFRAAKLVIWLQDNTTAEQQVLEALLLTNGSSPLITTYGTIFTGSAPIATFDAGYSAGTTALQITRVNANSTSVKVEYTLIES
jgi:hypothetical protein